MSDWLPGDPSDRPRVGAATDLRFLERPAAFCEHVGALGLEHVEFKRGYLGSRSTPPAARLGAIAAEYGLTVSMHVPFRDCNVAAFDPRTRHAAVETIQETITDAAAADALAVVVHGGSVPARYPDHVTSRAREGAIESLQTLTAHAERVGVPLALENQPRTDRDRRFTTTPDDLAAMCEAVDTVERSLDVTLDVGHATASGQDWHRYVDRFGDRIRAVHMHDNDGTRDAHEPFEDLASVLDAVSADYAVFEVKSLDDLQACVDAAR
ncbi:sugar phosphate isomerase/epimerase family protein [Halococcoides cellulosivorans]|uniref:Sugar phosphate isomerase/epimerase n=1 Tax=Halococcoides cellulosivorans TaxID=1679096 RepID=A0A2R4X4F7_9EURY|nr:sugar phosphate isomerase/epimerase [Halococcoides cellulosivorans]AWB28681.1 sugar phosphate isomerase/epimerase [Halococcoides cellulosivorans]